MRSAAKVMVIGQSGQLARELAQRAPPHLALSFLGRDRLDLEDAAAVTEAVVAARPDLVIIAAAYTAVDRAEADEPAAWRVNARGPEALARACAQVDAPLVHVSTDYVFDGAKPTPYKEDDPVAPINAYGRSKAAGEAAVLASGARSAVVRTSWVYSPFGGNFVKTMLRLSQERDELRVVGDQMGRPTSAADLARTVLAMGERLIAGDRTASGLFHFAGEGDASWARFAQAVVAGSVRRGGRLVPVVPITTAEFPTPARRPMNSRLDCSRIASVGVVSRPWTTALDECLDALFAHAPS